MKVMDILETSVDEGWKDWVAAGAMGAASLGATPNTQHQPSAPQSIVQQVDNTQLAANNQAALAQTVTGNPRELVLIRVAKRAGLTGHELAAFMSQSAHETGNFVDLREKGDDKYFRRYDIRYNPAKAKALGNIHPGDGIRYRGRGFLQITGRANYAEAGTDLTIPLEQHPELLERPDIAAKVAIWYWNNHTHNKVKNFKNTRAVTKTINPGLKDLNKRNASFKEFDVASL